MTNLRYFEPGDVVVLRNVETPESLQMVHAVLGDPAGTAGQYPFLIGGKIVTVGARPYRVVSDTAEATVLFQPEGTLMPRWQIEEKRYLDDPQRSRGESLRFIFPDRWFDVTLFFETDNEPPWFFDALFRGGGLQAGWRERRADWGSLEPDPTAAKDTNERFRGWYCNVQAPYWRRPYGFDFANLTLDVVVRADRRWYWKDVDELETAIAKGACPEALATHIRASGQEVVKLIESASGPSDESWTRWRAPEDWAIDAFPDGWQHFSPMADMPAFGRPSVNP